MKGMLKKIFKCPPDRKLIMAWKVKTEGLGLAQTVTETTISIGSYKIFSWATYYTPMADWKNRMRLLKKQ